MDINVSNSKEEEPKKYFYVALYYPAGNKPGEYKENVLPRKISKA